MTDILMPALSLTMEEGMLAKWNVKAGDTVKAGVIAQAGAEHVGGLGCGHAHRDRA